MHRIVLSGAGLELDGHSVDVSMGDAVERLLSLLGPERVRRPVGVDGSGRTGHWLESGIVLMSQLSARDLVAVYVCFDPMASPFDADESTSVFSGEVVVLGRAFQGGEGEKDVWSLPGVEGWGGLLGVRDGDLDVGFELRRRVGRFGRRTGVRELVQLSAEWGGVRGFPRQDGTGDPLMGPASCP